MSRSARQHKRDQHLRSLEKQFSKNLMAALRDCAAGKWGMFGHNDSASASAGKYIREGLQSKVAYGLLEEGEQIEALRQELGFPQPFHPFRRYLEYRQLHGSNVPGEPKLAMQFLEELETNRQ